MFNFWQSRHDLGLIQNTNPGVVTHTEQDAS